MPLARPSSFSRVSSAAGDRRAPSIADRIAVLEVDRDHRRLVGRVLRADGALVDDLVGLDRRVFQDLSLGRRVQQVGIDAERRLAALVLGDRDLVLLGELQQPGAAGQLPFAPRGDDLDVGLQRVIAELEAHLVVALAGRAMRHRIGADLFGDLDLALRDQRAGDRGAEQILALVQRVGAEHREDEVAHEGLAQIVDEDFLHAEHLGLLPRRAEFLALAEIGGEGDHLAAIGHLQPAQDHAGVEPAGIGEHDLLHILHAHGGCFLLQSGILRPREYARQPSMQAGVGRASGRRESQGCALKPPGGFALLGPRLPTKFLWHIMPAGSAGIPHADAECGADRAPGGADRYAGEIRPLPECQRGIARGIAPGRDARARPNRQPDWMPCTRPSRLAWMISTPVVTGNSTALGFVDAPRRAGQSGVESPTKLECKMAAGQWRIRLTEAARRDYADIIDWTVDRFGQRQARRYAEAINRAIGSLTQGPDAAGSRASQILPAELRILPIARDLAQHLDRE